MAWRCERGPDERRRLVDRWLENLGRLARPLEGVNANQRLWERVTDVGKTRPKPAIGTRAALREGLKRGDGWCSYER